MGYKARGKRKGRGYRPYTPCPPPPTLLLVACLFLLLCTPAYAKLETHSGSDTVRVLRHTGEISIEGDFARTNVSLSFTNHGTQKEGVIYRFTTPPLTAPVSLEIKLAQGWQKGVLLDAGAWEKRAPASPDAFIDPGLLVKEGPGAFALYAYPVPPGGTLSVRFSLISYVMSDPEKGFVLGYPDGGDAKSAVSKLSILMMPPSGRTLQGVQIAGREAKKSPQKGRKIKILPEGPVLGGSDVLTWQLAPRKEVPPLPEIELITAAQGKEGAWLYLRLSLDPPPFSQDSAAALDSYEFLGAVYDTPLPEGSVCTGSLPEVLSQGMRRFLLCHLPGAAPREVQIHLSKDGVPLKKPLRARARALPSVFLGAVFLTHLEESGGAGALSLPLPEPQGEAPRKSARERFFALAEGHGVVTKDTALLVIDPEDEFSRDVVNFSRKWGGLYASRLRGGPNVLFGAHPPYDLSKDPKDSSLLSAAKKASEKARPSPSFSGYSAQKPEKMAEPRSFPQEVTDNERKEKQLTDPLAPADEGIEEASLSPYFPLRLLQGSGGSLKDALTALQRSSRLAACLKNKEEEIPPEASLSLAIEAGEITALSLKNASVLSPCVSEAIRAISFPEISVRFEVLLSAIF